MKFIKPQHRKESQCKCRLCKMMCLQSPCFPTPEEVEKLVAAGHGEKLMPSLYIDPASVPADLGLMQAVRLGKADAYEVIAPTQTNAGCIFLENGMCTLHDKGLKPLEGRLAYHDTHDSGLRVWVCKKWQTEKGKAVFDQFEKSVHA